MPDDQTRAVPARDSLALPETLHRAATIRADAVDAEKRTFELSFSSEAPVRRWFGDEILDHAPGSVDLSRLNDGGAVLVDHDTRDQVGVVERAWIDKKIGRAVVRLGQGARASEILADVADGIRRNVSVGYRVGELLLEKTGGDGPDVYRATDWQPLEISIVAVPADASVGVGREAPPAALLTRSVPVTVTTPTAGMPGTATERNTTMPETQTPTTPTVPATPAVDTAAVRAEAQKAERERMREITELGRNHQLGQLADHAIADGTSVEEFRKAALDAVFKRAGQPLAMRQADGDPTVGLTDNEIRQFSMLRALRHCLDPNNAQFRNEAGFEIEVSQAAIKKRGREVQGAGFGLAIPADVMRAPLVLQPELLRKLGFSTRDLTVGSATGGGNLVATDLLAPSMIELLRNRAVVTRVGATLLGDLNGNVAIPRQTGGATAYWVAEGVDLTESQQTIGQLALTPKTVGAYTEYTRQLMMQSSIDIENFVRADLMKTVALAVDLAAIYGTGSAGQPTGVTQTAGINTKDFAAAAPTWAEIVDMETLVAADNADFGSLAYVTDPTQRGAMKTTEKASGTAQFVWQPAADGEGEVNGYRALASTQMTAGDVVFGNWADLIVGMWGGFDIMVNPYAKDVSGGVRVVALQSMDIGVRHAVSFCLGNDDQ